MKYIDQLEIYRATDDGRMVFEHYFPGYEFGNFKAYISIRPEDKTPSARITYFQALWRITDFGNQKEINSLPAIQWVMFKESLVFIDALRFIEDVIIGHKVDGKAFVKPDYKARYSYREMTPDDQKGEYRFVYKKEPSLADLESIGRYVDAELLRRFNCRSVESYDFCGVSKKLGRDVVHTFASTDTYPIFVFDYGEFKKLYKPYEIDKKHRFVYVGKKPKNYIYGLKQLLEGKNEFANEENTELRLPDGKPDARVKDLFRCSGESDSLNLASLGLNVYWLNSETAAMDKTQWAQVDELCENHYQVMDLDATGQQSALDFALKHINLHTLYLPDWLRHKSDWRGNPCKDAKDFVNISGDTVDRTFNDFLVLKRRSMPMKFWTKQVDDKGKVNYNINLEFYYHFLRAHGFYVMDSQYHRRAGYCYARVEGKTIELIHPDDIKKIVKRFTKEWIRSKNLMDEIAILNKINSSNQISEANLQELSKLDPVFYNCDKTTEFIHFKNGSLRIRQEAIEKIPHQEVPNYILGKLVMNDKQISHQVDREIKPLSKPLLEIKATEAYQALLDRQMAAKTVEERNKVNMEIAIFEEADRYTINLLDTDFVFLNFLKDLAHIHWRKEEEKMQPLTDQEKKEQDLALVNLLFVLGWNISEYKDPGRPWLTFLQDMKISQVGKSSGRSGKSLFSEAITKVRPSFYIGGRQKEITNKTEFIYDGFTVFHNNIEVDDLYEFADFNFFYTQVTGKREVNSKFISKQILDYKHSGKMLISSNFELQNTDTSTLARILNVGVSDYYHEKTKYNDYLESRSPLSKFGKTLYDDFTDEEWNKFYHLMAYCIQLQQRFFKIQPPMANLEKRQLRREMTYGVSRDEEFWIWANSYFVMPPPSFKSEQNICPSDKPLGYYNTFIIKEKAFEDFKTTLPDMMSKKYKITQFRKSLESFCAYYGFELNPVYECGSNLANIEARRIVKTIEGKSTEVFIISTAATTNTDILPVSDEPSEETPF